MSVYDQLTQVTNEYGDTVFDEILRRKLGSEGAPIPLILQHSIGKFQSSFPAMYLEGDYPAIAREGGREAKSTMLLQQPPNRKSIEAITKEWKDDEKTINTIFQKKVASISEMKNSFNAERVKDYLDKVDKEGSVAISTIVRMII